MLKKLDTPRSIDGNSRRKPTPLDTKMGNLLRQKRTLAGLTQEEVGNRVDLTYQSYQRYENGKHRLQVCLLVKLAEVIGFDPVQFLAEFVQTGSKVPVKDTFGTAESRLVTAFTKIKSAKDRDFVLRMARHFAQDVS